MSNLLSDADLQNCALIIDRGVYFYNQITILSKNEINKHELCTLCYFIRSLSEITTSMDLWFKSIQNIKSLSAAALIDHAHLMVKLVKEKKKKAEKPLTKHDLNVLEHAKDKYHALYYKDGKCQLSQFRQQDDLYNNTLAMTSKIIHQDEFSILGSPDYVDFDKLQSHYLELGKFWSKDFKNRIHILFSVFPNIVSYYESNNKKLPFKYDQIEF